MAKEPKEGTPKREVTPKAEEVTQKVEVTPQTPNELEQLRGQLKDTENKLNELGENYKNVQRADSKKAEEIQSLRDDRDLFKAMIAVIAEKQGITEEEAEQGIQARKPNLLQQFDQLDRQRQQRRYVEKANSYRATVEGELNLKPGDEEYDIIQGLVVAGKFDKADRRIEAIKAKSATPPPTSEKKETEDEKVERRLKEELEKRGLLTTETGEPSASSKTRRDIIARYARGEATRQQYEEAMKSK